MGQDEQGQLELLPPPQPARPTHVRYLVLAGACSLAVLTYVQRQGFPAAGSLLKKDLDLNDEQWGYLASVWLLAYGAFQVPGGLLGDRLGARRLLTVLVLGWSLLAGAVTVTLALPAGWLVFAALLALRFLFGMFQAGGFPGLARVVADWMPARQRGFAQGMVWTWSRLGGALSPVLVVLLIKLWGGWAVPFWLIAGLGWLWCAGFWLWFRDRPEQMRGVNAAERALIASVPPQPGRVRGPVPWSRFFRSRNVWALCLMYGFVGFSGNFVTSLLPAYLSDHRHLNYETMAWLSGLPLACGIVSCLAGGVLSDWLILRLGSRIWGRRLVGCTTLVLAGLSVLGSIWADQVWLLALAFSAMFFFNDGTMAPAWAACADIGEEYAGTLSGAMNMTGAFLGAAGMGLAGACFHRGVDAPVFIAFACSYGLGALCWLMVDVTQPLVPPDD
jgi:ACS family glucarate transporter-like MFS transporter